MVWLAGRVFPRTRLASRDPLFAFVAVTSDNNFHNLDHLLLLNPITSDFLKWRNGSKQCYSVPGVKLLDNLFNILDDFIDLTRKTQEQEQSSQLQRVGFKQSWSGAFS